MALNLIDVLEQLFGSNEVLSRIGALIGLSPERTKAAVGAAVPAILAALVGVAQKPEGRNQLAAQVQGQDTNLLDNLSGALSGGREKSFSDSGKGMLSSLFGQGGLDQMAGAVGKFAGLNQSSAGSLLGALAPAVMGVLGRQQRLEGLDSQGLANLLIDQKDNIAHALPAGLASTLGSTGLLDGVAGRVGQGASTLAQAGRTTAAAADRTASLAASRAAGVANESRRSGGSMLRWAIPLIAILAVLWAGYHFLFRSQQVPEVANQAPATTGQVVAGKDMMVGDVDVGKQVTDVIADATKTLTGITDSASATAAVTKLNGVSDSLTKVGGLVDQLPAAGKSALAALVSAALPNLEALVAKVEAIPGAADVIKPAADSMLESLRAMTA